MNGMNGMDGMDGMDGIILESCHSTWIVDPDRMRFRRMLKDVSVEGHAVTTNWRPYYHFHFDPQGETFTVSLNPEGTRRIQSWRHNEDCVQCAGHVTAELSLADLRLAVAS